MTYDEIHERLARLTNVVDIPKIEALRARITAGQVAVSAARAAGKPDTYTAPAETKLLELKDELGQMELHALTPFKVALGLALIVDDLSEVELPKGSVVSASIPGACDWTVQVGLDVIPF
jgi:hypothetical protein